MRIRPVPYSCSKPSNSRIKISRRLEWVRVAAAQPIDKDDIGDYIDQVPAHLLEDVYVNLAEYTGQV